MSLKKALYNFLDKSKLGKSLLKKNRQRKENKLIKTTHKYCYVINDKLNVLLNEFVFYPMCGTLLGVVRENDFLKHDDDMDYGILIDDKKDWKKLYQILLKNGFTLHHFYQSEGVITEMSFRYKKVHVDFFYIDRKDDNTALIYGAYKVEKREYKPFEWSTLKVPFKYLEGTFEKKTEKTTFKIPNYYKEFLIANYGENYMTPIRGIKTENVVGSRTFYENIQTFLQKGKDFLNYIGD